MTQAHADGQRRWSGMDAVAAMVAARGIAWTAGQPGGTFALALDDVELR